MALFTRSGEKKELFCKSCNAVTEHMSVTRSEAVDIGITRQEKQKLSRLAGILVDNTPLAVLDGQPYICTRCHRYRTNGAIYGDEL